MKKVSDFLQFKSCNWWIFKR